MNENSTISTDIKEQLQVEETDDSCEPEFFDDVCCVIYVTISCRYLVYSEADFEVFRLAGVTRCTDGVKFGTEEGPLLIAKFHPHRCNDKGISPPS